MRCSHEPALCFLKIFHLPFSKGGKPFSALPIILLRIVNGVHGVGTVAVGVDLVGILLIQNGAAHHNLYVRVGFVKQGNGLRRVLFRITDATTAIAIPTNTITP